MTNSRQKGRAAQLKVLKLLNQKTGKSFMQTPGSGSGVIKGDLYYPKCKFCIEIKHYAQSPFNDKILTSKSNNFLLWWNKLVQQSKGKKPLLIFKYNRSKQFVGTNIKPTNVKNYIDIPFIKCYVMLLQQWLQKEKIQWD